MGVKAIEPPPNKHKMPGWLNFVIGGTSGMLATFVIQPMDLLKTRMQLIGPAGKNVTALKTARDIVKNEGYLGFYDGLSAALFRQATYATCKLGCFNVVFDYYKATYGVPSFPTKVAIGMLSGGFSAVIGNPADVALIRMTADGRLPPEKKRNYNHVFNALSRITREEGVGALFSGVGATVSRAVICSGAQLSSYAEARQKLVPLIHEGLILHFCAAMIAGLVTSVVSLPVDIIKTRVQNASTPSSQLGVLSSILKHEGVFALWSGFLPTYAKIGPHTVLMFVFFEQLNLVYYKLA